MLYRHMLFSTTPLQQDAACKDITAEPLQDLIQPWRNCQFPKTVQPAEQNIVYAGLGPLLDQTKEASGTKAPVAVI